MNPNTTQSRGLSRPCVLAPLAAGLLVALAGCSGGAPSELPTTIGPVHPAPTVREVTADWADVPAAVDIAVSRCETAISHTNDDAEHYRLYQYHLYNIREQRGLLTVERVNPPAAPSPRSVDKLAVLGAPSELIRITVHIDPNGDESLEAALLSAVTERLAQLKGKGAAPISDEAQGIKDK